jgi:hypothetical protein
MCDPEIIAIYYMILRKIFWFCSGIYLPLLKKAPTEAEKYFGIGGTVFFTGLFASLSAGYALFTVFQELFWAVLFGVFWGLMILNLDRFIVSSMRKQKDNWKEVQMAAPRIVLAVLLAIVISKPLELKIFEKEINRKLDDQKIAMSASSKEKITKNYPEIAVLRAQADSLKQEVERALQFRNEVQLAYDNERFGTKTSGTSGVVGLGTNAKKKEIQLDAAEKQLEEIRKDHQARIDEIQLKIEDNQKLQQADIVQNQKSIESYDGLAARLDALSILQKESEAIFTASIFITLLFIAIETAPILVKLISNKGPYDWVLQSHEDYLAMDVKERSLKNEYLSTKRLNQLIPQEKK